MTEQLFMKTQLLLCCASLCRSRHTKVAPHKCPYSNSLIDAGFDYKSRISEQTAKDGAIQLETWEVLWIDAVLPYTQTALEG